MEVFRYNMARTMSFFIFGILVLESRLCSGLGDLTPVNISETTLIHDTIIVNYFANSFRSFQEVIDRFDYLKDAHVDAIWLSSIFPRSHNHSVTNYMDVHQGFGNTADFERLLEGAHKHGIKVILAVMPYETSDQHPWFRQWSKNGSPYNKFYVTEIFEFWLNKGVDGFMIEGLWQYVASSEGVFPYSKAIVENNKGYLQKIRMFIDHWTIKHNSSFKYLGARASEAKDAQVVYYRTKVSPGPDEGPKLTTLFFDLKAQPDSILTSHTSESLRAVNATGNNSSAPSPRASIVPQSLPAKRDETTRAKRAAENKYCCGKDECNVFQNAVQWMIDHWVSCSKAITCGLEKLKDKLGKKKKA